MAPGLHRCMCKYPIDYRIVSPRNCPPVICNFHLTITGPLPLNRYTILTFRHNQAFAVDTLLPDIVS
jgi:hypothetical protein